MTISTTGVGTAASSSAGSAMSRTTMAQNFDAFLLLLTTQLKNQSPLDPLDTNQFTQQLVQFASVEQQLKSNDTLNALLTNVRASTNSTAGSFVGMDVTADGATSRLANGKATWVLNPARNAQAEIVITDKEGNIIAAQTKALSAGAQNYEWDGRTMTGTRAPDGDYTITVTARDATGQGVSVKSEISGKVTSVDLSGEVPVLMIGTFRVPLPNVRSLSRAN
ncbi:MAG TPA: flagellar hook capping FlgD N-terminal domain-containing protein [Beijerinckiaceae bacterium]|jgi:flagellar basal-body rod modification protein FlgD